MQKLSRKLRVKLSRAERNAERGALLVNDPCEFQPLLGILKDPFIRNGRKAPTTQFVCHD
jgi:hypothetical protein